MKNVSTCFGGLKGLDSSLRCREGVASDKLVVVLNERSKASNVCRVFQISISKVCRSIDSVTPHG